MNTAACTESTAKFMAEALLNHAREVSRYAGSYPSVFETLPAERVRQAVAKFVKNVTRMVKEMHALMLMARYKGVSRFCNQEQVEAYLENAREIVEEVGERYRTSCTVVESTPATFN